MNSVESNPVITESRVRRCHEYGWHVRRYSDSCPVASETNHYNFV